MPHSCGASIWISLEKTDSFKMEILQYKSTFQVNYAVFLAVVDKIFLLYIESSMI